MPATPTLVARAMSPEESRQAALHGHRALTPILSGAISGGIVGVAWIVGIIYWLYKRHRRARRAKAAGFASYREFVDPPKLKRPFILPPDPAILKGQVLPGQKIVVSRKHKHKEGEKEKDGHETKDGDETKDEDGEELRHARTVPMTRAEERELEVELQEDAAAAYGSTVSLSGSGPIHGTESAPPEMVHRAAAPARMPSRHSVKSTRSLEHVRKRDTYPPRSSLDNQTPPRVKLPEEYWYHKRNSG